MSAAADTAWSGSAVRAVRPHPITAGRPRRPARTWLPMGAVADRLEAEIDELTTAITTLLCQRLGPYGELRLRQIVPGVAISVRFGIVALRQRRLATDEETEQLATVAETRAEQGLPVEALLQAYRLGTHLVWERARQLAEADAVDPSVLLEAAELVWHWSEQVTARAAATHRRAELALARHDQQYRTEFLRAAVLGTLTVPALREQAPRHGLDPDRPYQAVRAAAGGVPLHAVERALVDAAGSEVLAGVIDSDLVGLVPAGLERRRLAALGTTVGVGPLVSLASAPQSFAVASQVLRTAVGFGRSGVFDLASLGPLVAVASQAELGEELARRYLGPLAAVRHRGRPLRQSVEQYLAAGLHIDNSARALFVHPNTMRYRLRRFEEVTGARLDRVEDLVGIWWALAWQQLRHGDPGEPAPQAGSPPP